MACKHSEYSLGPIIRLAVSLYYISYMVPELATFSS